MESENKENDYEASSESSTIENELSNDSKENENDELDHSEEKDVVIPEKKSIKILEELVSWAKVILVALILSFILNVFILFNFRVPTESMENTIMAGNKVMSLRCAYWFSDPERFDIIVFPFPDNPSENYIKRVIGLPGETVEGKDGLVYIDGVALEEDYVTSDLDEDFGPYVVPEDSYFVLGDNRDISKDARYWRNKFVKREDIISKAFLRFYPNIKVLK